MSTRTLLREGSAKGSYQAARAKTDIPEQLLARLGQKQAALQRSLRTEAGRQVPVIYPGRAGTTAGPDLPDVPLEIEGLGLVRGDVEIHVGQSDWHLQNPNYNGVMLHSALEVEWPATELRSGQQAPVVALGPCSRGPGPRHLKPQQCLVAGAEPAKVRLARKLK